MSFFDLRLPSQGRRLANDAGIDPVKITYLPHAFDQMKERGIPESEARAVLENPDLEYPGYKNRITAERVFEGRRTAVKVVYNLSLTGERVVITVEYGRPTRLP